jgi:hypothetical protein
MKFKELHEDTTLHNIQNHDDKQFYKHVQRRVTAETVAWLRAVPDGRGMDIPHDNFMNEIRSRLYIPHPSIPEDLTYNCDEDTIVDQHGLRLHMCPTENQRLQRHNYFLVAEPKVMSQHADLTAHPNNARVSPAPSDGRRGGLHIISLFQVINT